MHSFARVVETGSFSAVARELGTGQPNVSRHIAALERHLGTRLLHRSTRKLTLTPEGERYYTETRRVIDAITEAESNARGEDVPQGLLRVACPTLLGRSHILPQVKAILAQFPEMEIDLQIGDRYIDWRPEAGHSKIVRSRRGVLAPPSDSASRAASTWLNIQHRPTRSI
jgi:LysR family transcriptional regulator for bpeEF and oprC